MGDRSQDRAIVAEIDVAAPLEDVWQAWTTEAGARTFLAPRARIELRPGGAYEMLFDLDAPPRLQGGEGNQVLALQPPSMLSFSWNAPPELDGVRQHRTHVCLRLSRLDDRHTLVRLQHDGWGEGEEWDSAFRYFQRAWGRVVLPRLRYRFERGPLDWDHPPEP